MSSKDFEYIQFQKSKIKQLFKNLKCLSSRLENINLYDNDIFYDVFEMRFLCQKSRRNRFDRRKRRFFLETTSCSHVLSRRIVFRVIKEFSSKQIYDNIDIVIERSINNTFKNDVICAIFITSLQNRIEFIVKCFDSIANNSIERS